MKKFLSVVAAGSLLAGCADNPTTAKRDFDGPGVEVRAAALQLDGVGDVVWDIQVVNTSENAGARSVVWEQRISSSQYGNGAGSASYVGPCDASKPLTTSPTPHNDVRVWVVGMWKNSTDITSVGNFNYGVNDVTDTVQELAFQNPTVAGADGNADAAINDFGGTHGVDATLPEYGKPLVRTILCEENKDSFVQFDVALMRSAQQGFFDIAVNFNNIFCSAKFDCSYADQGTCGGAFVAGTTPGTCSNSSTTACSGATQTAADAACLFQDDINLLFAQGGRSKTMILGFACTAGVSETTVSELWMDNIQISCNAAEAFVDNAGTVGTDESVWTTPLTIVTKTDADGNVCASAGKDDGSQGPTGCNAARDTGAANTYVLNNGSNLVFQAGIYRGQEYLNGKCTSGLPNTTACVVNADCDVTAGDNSGVCGGNLNKQYWNVAIGVDATAGALANCKLRTKGTANDRSDDNLLVGPQHDLIAIPDDYVYPYVLWNVALDSCTQQPLTFNDTAMVRVSYSQIDTDTTADSFTGTYSPQADPNP